MTIGECMITKDNLPDILPFLGFHKRGTVYSKSLGAATLVSMAKEEIIYPEDQGMVINESVVGLIPQDAVNVRFLELITCSGLRLFLLNQETAKTINLLILWLIFA